MERAWSTSRSYLAPAEWALQGRRFSPTGCKVRGRKSALWCPSVSCELREPCVLTGAATEPVSRL
jgi:hypothetical protein